MKRYIAFLVLCVAGFPLVANAGFIAGEYTRYMGGLAIGATCKSQIDLTGSTPCSGQYQSGTDSKGTADTSDDTPIMTNKHVQCSSNKCDADWKGNGCFSKQQIHTVEWFKACPKGMARQDPASYKVSVFADYVGHGNSYDPSHPEYDGTDATSRPRLFCYTAPRDSADDGGLQDELSADLAMAPGPERAFYPLMGCSPKYTDGRWHPGYGVRDVASMTPAFPIPSVKGPTGAPAPVPADCRGPTEFTSPQITKYVCYPEGCNLATMEGCDIPQGYYHFYALVTNLRQPINNAGAGPDVCQYPAFSTSDFRYCGGSCVSGDGQCGGDNWSGGDWNTNNYYSGVNRDETPIPGEQFYFSAFSVAGMGQPTYKITNPVTGEYEYSERAIKINSFMPSSGPSARIPSEVPAGMGVKIVEAAGETLVDLGVTPLQVRSLECPKMGDGYMPIQNIALGQTERVSYKDFAGDAEPVEFQANVSGNSSTSSTSAPYVTMVEDLEEKTSCELVEEVSKEIKDYNILPQGQANFGMAHSISTAVNQLLKNHEKGRDIPILTVALSEPVRDCINSGGNSPIPPEKPNQVPTKWDTDPAHSYFRGSETKWGSHDNSPNGGVPGELDGGSRDARLKVVKCLADKFTDAYPEALREAAKRVKDAGGFVVTVATSCASDRFLETLSKMSSGSLDLRNFSPEGVVIGSDCDAGTISEKDGEGKAATKLAHSIYFLEVDEDDSLFFRPAIAASAMQPLYGTINDVFAEIAWVLARDQVGQEICSNQDEGQCDDAN